MANVTHRLPGQGSTLRLGPGEFLTDLATSEDTGGNYSLYEVVSSTESGVPLHAHDWDEAFYVLDGRYRIDYIDGDDEVRSVEATPGSFVHVPAGEYHAFRNLNDGFSKMLSLNHPVGLEPILRKTGLPVSEPGAIPEQEPLPPEEFKAIFADGGIKIHEGKLAETGGVGAWKDDE
jgi:quercetin dioxygenase-like cupin family protein